MNDVIDLEETVRRLEQTNDDQKRQIDTLNAQKIEQKLEFDTQLNTIQRNYQNEMVIYFTYPKSQYIVKEDQ